MRRIDEPFGCEPRPNGSIPPPTWHLRWYGFPDLEAIRRKTGLQFIPVELRELIYTVQKVDAKKAAFQADKWMADAPRMTLTCFFLYLAF